MLRGIALCCQDNTGKLPTTMKELADHWYDLSDTLVILDPPERLIDVDTDHMRQCVWLRDLEKRPMQIPSSRRPRHTAHHGALAQPRVLNWLD